MCHDIHHTLPIVQGQTVNDALLVEDIIAMHDGNQAHAMKKMALFTQYGKFTVRNGKLQSIERMPLPA